MMLVTMIMLMMMLVVVVVVAAAVVVVAVLVVVVVVVSFHSQRGSPSLASVFCQDNIWYVTPAVFDSTYLCKYRTKPAATAPKSLVKHGSIETNRRRYEREIQKRVEQKSRRSHDV